MKTAWIAPSIAMKPIEDWNGHCLSVFADQFANNPVYRRYCELLNRSPQNVIDWTAIPFLPVRFFKSHSILCEGAEPSVYFESSSTTGQIPSRHGVADIALYEKSFRTFFEAQYGSPSDYCILALLPSYLERQHSSLVYMVNDLVQRSNNPNSGFFLYNFEELVQQWKINEEKGVKTMLFGVTFALLDLAERFPMPIRNTIIMETGGMKGRGREPIRSEVHELFRRAWGKEVKIHSEYGMTELLSQGYSCEDEGFETPPWMRVILRDSQDPLTVSDAIKRGGINVVDLANVHSCPFLATDDLGERIGGRFRVLGRLSTAETRGCNLLYTH